MASLPTKKIQFHLGELTNIINDFKAACVAEKAASGEDEPSAPMGGEVAEPGAQDSAINLRGNPNGLKYIPPGGGLLEDLPGYDRLRRNGGK
jgi:hypothetical protein